jgi:hypothetical protein
VRAAIRTLLTILSLLFATMALTYTAKFVVIFIRDIFTHPAFPVGFFLEDAVDSFYSDQWPAAMPFRSYQLVRFLALTGVIEALGVCSLLYLRWVARARSTQPY